MTLTTKTLLRLLITLSVLAFLCAYQAITAEAHTLAIGGTIGAVLHTDPNDEPVAGSPATLVFEFKDTNHTFMPSEFVLNLVIAGAGTSTTNSFAATGAEARVSYTFPAPGIYTVNVAGTPVTGSAEPFSLSYQIRVTAAAASGGSAIGRFFGVHGAHVLLTGTLIAILLAVIGFEKRKEYLNARRDNVT